MITLHEHDYIRIYMDAAAALHAAPDDRDMQHRAVLALAQAGSLDFALSEYQRLGLDKIRNHEDIMALGGRLSKDLYLRAKRHGDDTQALEHARNSAHLYEAAFQQTRGFYSGINAAAMACIADMPADIVTARANAILGILPPAQDLTPKDHYFIEATRAECYLLLGEMSRARQSLMDAIAFDPLNYTIHATTARQFRMILEQRGAAADWLSAVTPPRALHYAGHILLDLQSGEDTLAANLTDELQRHDIGFGYGALAAGSDIIIAEALLREGAKLHVVLPCPVTLFAAQSVAPFGAHWQARFETCLKAASSVDILTQTDIWPEPQLGRSCAKIAMGQAVLRNRHFGTSPAQLLIWDAACGASLTTSHAQDWINAQDGQIIIPAHRQRNKAVSTAPETFGFGAVMQAEGAAAQHFDSAAAAAKAAIDMRATTDRLIAIDCGLPATDTTSRLAVMLGCSVPQGIMLSMSAAALLALEGNPRFDIQFAGAAMNKDGTAQRMYSLS